ncbi:MAG: hypothetical protein IKK72_05685 [Oscillospiraceae bacterium]|nr:hypothetical protein [Oscillospiraceae bacterium]
MENLKTKAITLIKQYKLAALILAIGLVLMLLPTGSGEGEPILVSAAEPTVSAGEQLESILSQIQGVGKVQVLLTVAEGERTVYIYDEDQSDTLDTGSLRREAVVVTGTDRGQSGLVSQVIPPVYLGAVVVCQGGDLPAVKLAVVEAVCDATGLTADKVTVLKMK